MHQDDVAKILKQRGWRKGAGGDLYFGPEDRHLHLKLQSGFAYHDTVQRWIKFLAIRNSGKPFIEDGELKRGFINIQPRSLRTEAEAIYKLSTA